MITFFSMEKKLQTAENQNIICAYDKYWSLATAINQSLSLY